MKNNKGFMMAEVVVVSAIIIVTLTSLYVSYNKIIAIYNQRVDYYDVRTLYELAYIRDWYLSEYPDTEPKSDALMLQTDEGKVYYVVIDDIKNETTLSSTVENQTFKDYVKYLSTSLDFNKLEAKNIEKILVMERCIDANNCKYAYLEVYE